MATAPAYQQADSYFGDVTAGLGIAAGLQRGGVYGDLAAATSGARLAAGTGIIPKGPVGEFGNVLGIVGGIEQGGVAGYGGAAINAAELGARTGAFGAASSEVGALAGEAVIPLAVYNFAQNWRSGATGSDALSGAEAGAAIGSVVPGIGTLIGAGVGAAVGAVSSLFGPGREDPENIGWNQYATAYQHGGARAVSGASPSQNFQMLAGIFDSRGSSIPFYNAFGRMGENQFVTALAGKINQASARGQITPNDTPATIYSKVIQPWITAMGGSAGWPNTSTIQGAPEKQAVGNLITNLIGDYTSGQLNANTPVGISGQKIAGLPAYTGHPIAQSGVMPTGQFPVNMPSSTNPAPGSMLPLLFAAGGAAGAAGATGAMPNYQQPGLTSTGGDIPLPSQYPSVGAVGGTDPSGGAGLSPLATTGILEGIGLLGAGYAQHQSGQTIAPITQAGLPFIGASEQLLGESMSGQLTPQQAQVVKTSQTQGQSLITAASPVGQIAQQDFKAYQSGQLKPGDQAQLDQQVEAAKAQLIQTLGPNVDSSTLATYTNQIEQQAQITKQQMLNSYFATGNQAFDTWFQTTKAGQQAIVAGQEYAVTQIDNTFNKALEAGKLGGTDILAGIQAQIQSNSDLANAFGSYTSNLAKAYALMQAAKGIGGGGGGGGGGGATDTAGLTPDQQSQQQGAIDLGTMQATTAFNANLMTDVNAGLGNIPSTPEGSVSVGEPIDFGSTDIFAGGG